MIRPVFTEVALFLAPFVVYAIFLWGDARGRARSRRLVAGAPAWLVIAALVPDGRQLRRAGAFRRRAARLDLCAGACRGRQVRPGADEVSAVRHRLDAAWLREGALATLLAVLDRDGEEARVVGGAVRNALLGEPLGDIDIATTAAPDEVIAPGRGGGLQGGADRHRARHHHGGRRQAARSR